MVNLNLIMSGKGKLNLKKTPVKVRDNKSQAPVQAAETSSDGIEMSFALSVIKVSENSKLLPRYTSILQRTNEDSVGMEDLDTLQLELETLLSSVVVRSRLLQEEITCLTSAEERRDKRSKSGKGLSFEKKLRDEKSRIKDMYFKGQSPLSTKLLKAKTLAAGNSANQIVPNPHEIVRVEGSKTDVPKLLLPKNDTTNKFWASVDSYCADIMPDDIKLLEELIATHSDLGEFKKIPPLGRHYSYTWAHNDLLQEEETSNVNRDKKKNRSDVSALMSKVDKKATSIAGPLTQRLVSALMEENVYTPNSDSKLFRDGDPPVLRDLTIQNSMNLEMRMHKELVEQGILEPDSHRKNNEDDEILAEIKRCQQDLLTLSSHNVVQLKRLLSLAQEESKRQALKRKISAIDSEVVEYYNKLIVSKQRKVPLTKKEQEKAWASLREREGLLQQLNVLPSNNIGETVTSNVVT
ncbi:transcriptional adaptor 3 [Cotesia typhae]|uniref:transcriptional adaptor 3 n=1 Tax=Cotesia typhae TaxID=2053667 RepID=UPI003D69D4FE